MNSSLPVFRSNSDSSPFDARFARTWAEVDLSALTNNVRVLKRRAAQVGRNGASGDVMAVVKADAYGHGAVPIAKTCAAAGIGRFAVAAVSEALELRRAGVDGEIYLLSAFLPEEATAIIRADVIPFVSCREQADSLADAAQKAPFPARAFLTVDTGMGREGCLPEDARALWQSVAGYSALRFSGICTHFSSADEDEWEAPTAAQTSEFFAFLVSLGPNALKNADDGRGGSGVYLSLCNSPGALRLPSLAPLPTGTRGILHRVGASLYGIAPYPAAQESDIGLRPVLSWKARIVLVRDFPAGATLGYGRTNTLTRPSRIATVAAGYADGVPRALSNTGHVLYQGRRFPIVGRISMDQFQIDLTDAPTPPRLGDIITLLGSDNSVSQTAFDLAAQLQTTPHAPTCAITKRVPRVYRISS